jgi:ATP-dependent helicase HrpB
MASVPPISPLPITAVLPELIEALERCNSVVLRAPTGSGKTTRVPPAVLDRGLAGNSSVIMLEPRRIAARCAARRIAWERGSQVGGEVGYAVRFDQEIGPDTRIKIVTDGVLLRMLQDDPFLEQASVVIFDEFHERRLNADLALAIVRRVQQAIRPDLKIVVMSATLEVERVAGFLGGCPIIQAAGNTFPVAIRYQQSEDSRPVPERTAAAVLDILPRTSGDVLVFLPGVGEIRRTGQRLAEAASGFNVELMELYGDLPAERQDAVLRTAERRKVILATNVAETSITIEGVSVVIDTGLARVLRFDPSVGLDRLVLTKISRASSDQRAGRAGRTQAGTCVRLWTERSHAARPIAEEPEVSRIDVAAPVLQLMAWGEVDPAQFPWFEAPVPASLDQAQLLLSRLGAVRDGHLTETGQAIARLPVHPRIGRLLVEGQRLGALRYAATAAALLSERDPFVRDQDSLVGRGVAAPVRRTSSDLLDRVLAVEEFERTGRTATSLGRLNSSAVRHILRIRHQLRSMLHDQAGLRPPSDDALLRAVFAAFPDRIARRREPGGRGAVMSSGHGVQLAELSGVRDAELFVCVDVAADKSESLVRIASAIERDWLPPDRLAVKDQCQFDPVTQRVTASRCTTWDGLVLDQVSVALPDEYEVALILSKAAAQSTAEVMPRNDAPFENFVARLRCLRQWMPEMGLPDFNDDLIREAVNDICLGRRSFEELRNAPWLDVLKGKLTFAQLQTLNEHAPERLTVPSGSKVTLRYELGRPPVLAVRIQELFGLSRTPRIAGGRVPVLLHLLAPSMRPQQVTDDLESFWNNTYPRIRGELRRRYPKHAWPEDPRTALPQRRPGRL